MQTSINWHNVKTITMWVLLFVIGGLTALKGSMPGDFTTIISVLGFVEHLINGNTIS